MNKRGGRGEKTEEELVREYSAYVRDGGYTYNPNGLTYGDVNALMNDWDGYYVIYDWEGNKYGPGLYTILKYGDDRVYEEVIDETGARQWSYRLASESLTKEASVGMIIGQGDPSSPPSGIFMAEDPTRAEASDLGGPTEPSNAGVPADVGGDDLVPYDSPSAPPAGVFMNAESNVYETKPFKNAMLGIAFTISALTFWSTAGTAVKTYVVSVVDTYAPKLLEPQNKIIITTLALVGIVYFGNRLRSENQPLTIPRMIDLTEASASDV